MGCQRDYAPLCKVVSLFDLSSLKGFLCKLLQNFLHWSRYLGMIVAACFWVLSRVCVLASSVCFSSFCGACVYKNKINDKVNTNPRAAIYVFVQIFCSCRRKTNFETFIFQC